MTIILLGPGIRCLSVLPPFKTEIHGSRLFLFFAERTVVAVAITSFSPVRSAQWCGDRTGRTHPPGSGSWRGGLVSELAGPGGGGHRRDAGGRRGSPLAAPAVVGLRRAAVLGPLPRLLGAWRPARPGRPRRVERHRAGRGLRAGQPAARGRTDGSDQPVPVPGYDQTPPVPALPAHRGRSRVRQARRG